MTKIDTSNWGEFIVGDLFDIENGKYVDPKTLTIDDNGSPYLTASVFNNGQNADTYTGEGFKTKPNIISWGKQSPFFSYHTEACYTGQGIYWFEFDKGLNVALFICTVLQSVGKKYNYQNCLTGAKLKQETIKLPVNPNNPEEPDWGYMEAFMAEINKQAHKRVQDIQVQSQAQKHPIDTSNWGNFKVGDLFDIENGKYVDPKILTIDDNGSPYLTASVFNNGQNADKYIGEGFKTKPNIISWGKQSPFFSYHTEACYTGQGVYWFEFDKGLNVALFICTVLQIVGKKYNYQNCLTGTKLKQETIKLPVNPNNPEEPDWDYMEAFMVEINKQARKRVQELTDK